MDDLGAVTHPHESIVLYIVLSQGLAYSRCPIGIYSIREPPWDEISLLIPPAWMAGLLTAALLPKTHLPS